MKKVSRRRFVQTVAGTGAALTIVPRHVLGRGMQAPSDTVNIATIGIGGMGASNTRAVMSQNLVAACDIDGALMERALQQFQKMAGMAPGEGRGGGGRGQGARRREVSPAQQAANERRPAQNFRDDLQRFVANLPKLQKHRDYRKMLETQKDIDGVIIATPDHMHAPIASLAMEYGKHVYVQKPLCWSVEEARYLAKKAKDKKIVAQLGNQGHSMDDSRTGYEYINSGAIGDIREVHVWTNRPLGYWPQGVPRPAPLTDNGSQQKGWSGRDVQARVATALAGQYPVPADTDWDLFLGCAPVVEYHPIYHPFNWRGWVDWGQGALGDMGAHLIDHPFWALKLGYPTTIETLSTPFNGESYPLATTTYYEFPARGSMPDVKLTWYDGGFLPPRPEEMGETRLNADGGIMYVGSKGRMLQDTYGRNVRFLPQSLHDSLTASAPKQMLPRIAHEEHEMNWVEAIKGKAELSCPLDYAGPLNEVMLLGVVALRAAGSKIHYDGANMKVTNLIQVGNNTIDPNEFLKRTYRQGFELR
jgi:predicted dehydrogenase